MKQTAVEWLIEQYESNFPLTIDAMNQAKTMEKEQIKDAYYNGKYNNVSRDTAEQYYNETFKAE